MEDLKNLKCLLPDTQMVLQELIKHSFLSKYVLVGGSALSLHLCHRKSEDLDFFTYENNFNTDEILGLFKYFQKKEILNRTNELIDVLLDGVKVTFFNAHWDFLRPAKISNFNLATQEQIAIMKTNVLFLRAKYRDYYDLYFLIKKFGIQKVYEMSKGVVEGINFKVFASALLYIDDIEDENINHLQPKEKLSLHKIREFFEQELKK
ncbi:MAG: nucleotidyl transferase AbiEii/AbiGii toxin family protein [Desulfurella sp.]|uniref:nucleotidyl transferase AbiEii/AbiGii toxin family protein n=1 Tax=Desulfurella sp. TaxID=1962857 RepID=UPI003D0AD46B